ncbi:unnamed protein product [Rhizoctonia solani]|uniref:Uncharacterized protein n=1 Tax=Rhizoctonia solani TaxID=456999 RepID=A0A8H2X954_9AGAM|nr:unnamed protein product [Rhizoctonia solani]
MHTVTQKSRLFKGDSEGPIETIFVESDDDVMDKSESGIQGVSSTENTPPPTFPGVSSLENRQSKVSPRRVSASQPIPSSRLLRPRNDTGPLRRTSSAAQPKSSKDSRVSIKLPPRDDLLKVSIKRKHEELCDEPRVRKKLSFSGSEKSEIVSPSEPEPGQTSDGKIDYRYYIMKYLNQRD